MQFSFASHFDALRRELASVPQEQLERVADLLCQARQRGATLFFCGNGGSASTAGHFACDLGKGTIHPDRPRFRAVALTEHLAALTAWANDAAYDRVFVEQLANLYRDGDVLVCISGSGNSLNVLRAAEWVRERGGTVIGLIGYRGGRLAGLCSPGLAVVVQSDCLERIEDAHLAIQHALCTAIRAHDAAAAQGKEEAP